LSVRGDFYWPPTGILTWPLTRYVAEMLGHQKLETTMIYTRVSLTKLSAVHAACHPAENATRTTLL
jgi:integrase